jgi:hypothetical protein
MMNKHKIRIVDIDFSGIERRALAHLDPRYVKFLYLCAEGKHPIENTGTFLFLETETFPRHPLMVEITSDNNFLVSALPEGTNEFSSYVEVLITEKDADLYDYFTVNVGTLNMAGEGVVLVNCGEKYTPNTYCLYSTEKIHGAILGGKNIAHVVDDVYLE